MRCNRNGYYFSSGIISIVSAVLLAISLGTPRWIEAVIERKIQLQHPNSTIQVLQAGYKYFGMFRGCEEKTYANYFAARTECFDAFEELKLIARTDLACTTLVFSCLGLSFMILAVYITFYNELVHSVPVYLQFRVPLIILASYVCFEVIAIGAYLYLYHNNLKISVLRKIDLSDGFSTEGNANLGYSFWLVVASVPASMISVVLIYIAHLRDRKSRMSTRQRDNTEQGNITSVQASKAEGVDMMIF